MSRSITVKLSMHDASIDIASLEMELAAGIPNLGALRRMISRLVTY